MPSASIGMEPSPDQPDGLAANSPFSGQNILSSKSPALFLVLLWTGVVFGLSYLKLEHFIYGSLLWLVGLALAALGFRAVKSEAAKWNRALKALQERADQMERRVNKRSSSLHLRQRQLQTLMDNVGYGAYLKNNHHEFILVNPRFGSMINAPVEQLPALDGYSFLEPSVALKVKELEQKVITGKRALELYDVFDQAALPNGRIVTLHIFPVINPEGVLEGTGGLLQDVTYQHRQEQELIKSREEAQKAAQAKSCFLANISHELRSPLNGIIGTADLLARSDLTVDQAAMVAVIKSAGHDLLGALNDVLDLSKVANGTMRLNKRPFNPRELIFDSLKGLAPIARNKNMELIVDIAPQTPDELLGDDIRLQQILVNLVSNALKFTNEGEVRITLSLLDESGLATGAQGAGQGRESEWSAATRRFRLSVSDTGIGIPEDKRKIIFEAFEQVDGSNTRSHGGAGLGLTICYRLAAMMNAKLNLVSTEGQGSTFWLDLDLPVISEASPLNSRNVHKKFRGRSILCVGDSEAEGLALAESLGEWGLDIQRARGEDEALHKLKTAAEAGRPFDLLLYSTRSEPGPGRDLIETLAEEPDLAGIPVAALTSDIFPAPALPPDRPGVFKLFKPFRTTDLIKTIAAALGIWERFDTEALAAGLAAEATRISSRALKVLLVEDMEVNQIVARSMLEELGHQVTMAANGAEALRLFRENTFDLILMDIQMPVMDGLTAVARIRELEFEQRRPHTPVAAMTAHALEGDREKYLTNGLDGYLSKPLLMHELARLIEDMIKRWDIEGEPNQASPAEPAWIGRVSEPPGELSPDRPPDGPDSAEINRSPQWLDFEVTRLSFGGNRPLLRKSMELYLKDAPAVLDGIEAALEEGRPDEAATQAHALKGISSYYTKAGPYLLAMDLDHRASRADWPGDRPGLMRLAAELRLGIEALMAEMTSYLSHKD